MHWVAPMENDAAATLEMHLWDAAVATFTMVATIQLGAGARTRRLGLCEARRLMENRSRTFLGGGMKTCGEHSDHMKAEAVCI